MSARKRLRRRLLISSSSPPMFGGRGNILTVTQFRSLLLARQLVKLQSEMTPSGSRKFRRTSSPSNTLSSWLISKNGLRAIKNRRRFFKPNSHQDNKRRDQKSR